MKKTAVVDPNLILTDEAEAMRAYDSLDNIAFDIETTGMSGAGPAALHVRKNIVAIISFAAPGLPPAVLNYEYNGPSDRIIQWLNTKTLLGHNINTFDIPSIMKYGFDPLASPGMVDTLVTEQLALTADRRGVSVSLLETLRRRLDVQIDKGIDHAGWGRKELTEDQLRYAATDVQYVHRLFDAQMEKINKDETQDALQVEIDLAPIVNYMMFNGLPIHDGRRIEFLEKNELGRADTLAEIEEMLGYALNPNSPKQVKEAFHQLGIHLPKSDEEHMQMLMRQEGHVGRLADLVLRSRSHKKRMMYNDDWVNKFVYNNRVNGGYRQLGTDTGRFSSSEPNLQQVPREMRPVFGFDESEDWVVIKADYAQIEILGAAVLMRARELINLIQEGRDIHRYIASQILHKPEDEVTKDERTAAKAGSFTLFFAGGVHAVIGMARQYGLELTKQEAQNIVAGFYELLPSVYSYIAKTRQNVDYRVQKGMPLVLRIPGGPKRVLQPYNNGLRATRVVNTLVQGSCALGLKKGLINTRAAGIAPYVIGTVHDEIILNAPRRDAEEIAKVLEKCMKDGMEDVLGLVPNVEISIGSTWS